MATVTSSTTSTTHGTRRCCPVARRSARFCLRSSARVGGTILGWIGGATITSIASWSNSGADGGDDGWASTVRVGFGSMRSIIPASGSGLGGGSTSATSWSAPRISSALPKRSSGSRAPARFDDVGERTHLLGCRQRLQRARGQHADRRVGSERHAAGDRLHDHERQRVEIGAGVELHAARLLGRRVSSRAEHRARRFGPARLGEGAGQPEVGDAHDAVLVEEEVGGLDVAVQDATRVRVLERRRHVAADARGLGQAEASPVVEHRSASCRRPSSSSTMNGTSSSPQSWTVTMWGWCSDAASWASARNRRRKAVSSARAACSTFTATRRRSRVSSAA